MKKEKPNYFAVIPAVVRYDKRLSPQAKIIYAEITALINTRGYCFATNGYFAGLFDLNPISISRLISQLARNGCIDIQLERYKERKIILKPLPRGGINKIVKPNKLINKE